MAITEPSVTYLVDSYRFLWEPLGVDIMLDRLAEEKDGLKCEATIMLDYPPVNGLVRQGRFNLSSTRTRSEWINVLRREYEALPWHDIFEAVCALSLKRWRDGSPTIDLASVTERPGVPYLIDPFVVEGESSLIFGDGGSGKSLLAMAIAVTVATGEPILGIDPKFVGPVMYLDWEWDEYEHSDRLRAICHGAGIDVPYGMIHYRREYASLSEGASTIRREIAARGVRFVVCDSLGFARGGEPESADVTLKTFAAARTFGVPRLFIDHIPKDAKDKRYSFGSVYTRNAVRASWRIDAAKSVDGRKTAMGLSQAKENLGWEAPRGLTMGVEVSEFKRLTSVTFIPTDYHGLPVTAKRTLKDQIRDVLFNADGPMEGSDVWKVLVKAGVNTTEASVKTALSTNRNMFESTKQGYKILSRDHEEVFS